MIGIPLNWKRYRLTVLSTRAWEPRPVLILVKPCYTTSANQTEDDMPKKAIKRRAWTKEDVRELKTLAKAKTPAAKIARRFKRTEGALRQKALHLGISLNSRA